MIMKHFFLVASFVLAAQLASGKDESPAAAPVTPTGNGFSGKVVETTNTAGYTYVLVDTGAKKLWAAAPQFDVKVGDAVTVADGMPMPNYHSKSLNRDFDSICFSGGVTVNGDSPGAGRLSGKLPPNHPPPANSAAKSTAAKVDLTGIKRADGGQTIEEIFARKSKLAGKPIKVRGKVVKYNPMIMGRNWLHIRDGTGSAGSDDLTVTTAGEAKTGDTVLVTGNVTTDKNLGSGYNYEILIENAKVTVE
jgi:hypothetical protein